MNPSKVTFTLLTMHYVNRKTIEEIILGKHSKNK